ncbi:MAG: hypothetical protein CML99_15785 [Rhodobiaceae bacterium]|nr:hypothetical protein [Rhodobiaceae bacterium]
MPYRKAGIAPAQNFSPASCSAHKIYAEPNLLNFPASPFNVGKLLILRAILPFPAAGTALE